MELREKEELKKLVQTHSDKKSSSIPDLLAVQDSPGVVGSKEQHKFNLNPDFLFQPIDGGLIEIPMLLPQKTCRQPYTIVLDLDETLIHFDKEKKLFFVRPFTRHFLRELTKHYEIVIFTAAMKDYTDYILQRVDTENLISHKLYREHTTVVDNTFIKVAVSDPRTSASSAETSPRPSSLTTTPRASSCSPTTASTSEPGTATRKTERSCGWPLCLQTSRSKASPTSDSPSRSSRTR